MRWGEGMYGIVRVLIGIVFLGCFIGMINHSKVLHKRKLYIAFSGIAVALSAALWFLPFENSFITFDSHEAAYEYCHFGDSEPDLVIEGNTCDFVVDCKGEMKEYSMIPKTSDGWKIGIGSDSKIVAQDIFESIVVYVYQYKENRDFFVTVLDTSGGEAAVSDGYGSQFYPLETLASSGEQFVTYYAHLS